jgi:hypothetical protein
MININFTERYSAIRSRRMRLNGLTSRNWIDVPETRREEGGCFGRLILTWILMK